MRVPVQLAEAFGKPFEELISAFATEKGLMPEAAEIHSTRFLSRSVVPHIRKLSALFNRIEPEQPGQKDEDGEAEKPKPRKKWKRGEKIDSEPAGLDPYWKKSSNPAHFRLAYFLYFMPSNLFRTAAVWAELSRLGFRWPESAKQLRAIEFGAGPASGACGIAAGENHSPTGLPKQGNWALIEQDKAMLHLGAEWAARYFADQKSPEWELRPFHRQIDFKKGLLPPGAPRFNLWLMSFFLNESELPPAVIAKSLIASWEKHLDDEGLAILVEPALRVQSRKLLEIRKALVAEFDRRALENPEAVPFKLLLPCMGHQSCGALAGQGDWCHEEVTWWRPPYFRVIDQMAMLDRKTLPFSYLIVMRTKRSLEEILPALSGTSPSERYRLVSPSHSEGKELEFFVCGQEGKRRARYRPGGPASPERAEGEEDPASELDRGDILLGADLRGDPQATRVQKLKKRV